jgi:hypothetical protein
MELEKPPPRREPEGCLVVAVRLPVRIVVLVLVVPVRMVWDALVVAGRVLRDAVLRPLGRALLWLARALLVWPFVALWRHVLVPLGKGLAWLLNALLVLPAVWLYRRVLTPVGHALAWAARGLGAGIAWVASGIGWALAWLYARVLTPVGHGVLWVLRGTGLVLAALGAGAYAVLAWLVRYLVVVPVVWLVRYLVLVPAVLLYTWVLVPAGRAVAWCARGVVWALGMLVTGAGTGLYWITRVLLVLPALAVWRWVLVPVGRLLAVVAREAGAALGHAWRIAGRISLAVGRFLAGLLRWTLVEPVRWVYRSVLTPVGHVLRDAVLRPAAEAARGAGRAVRQVLAAARETARQTRADLRRALFGDPRPREAVARREPAGHETRTLDRRTTALTKD